MRRFPFVLTVVAASAFVLLGISCTGQKSAMNTSASSLSPVDAKAFPPDIPMACKLTAGQMAERKQLLAELTRGVRERRDLKEGVALRFDASGNAIASLGRLISLERECCPFLRFRLLIEAGDGPLWLEITSQPAAQDIVHDLFPAT